MDATWTSTPLGSPTRGAAGCATRTRARATATARRTGASMHRLVRAWRRARRRCARAGHWRPPARGCRRTLREKLLGGVGRQECLGRRCMGRVGGARLRRGLRRSLAAARSTGAAAPFVTCPPRESAPTNAAGTASACAGFADALKVGTAWTARARRRRWEQQRWSDGDDKKAGAGRTVVLAAEAAAAALAAASARDKTAPRPCCRTTSTSWASAPG
jgi:hypothetical protein